MYEQGRLVHRSDLGNEKKLKDQFKKFSLLIKKFLYSISNVYFGGYLRKGEF